MVSKDKKLIKPAKRPRWRTILRILLLIPLWTILLLLFAGGAFFLSFLLFPPFGTQRTAKVLIIGLDASDEGNSRSDTIMLYAGKLNGSGALLLSVPRDARVRIAGKRRYSKINAAYAEGKVTLLRETLAQPEVLGAELPYYVVMDSKTVAAMIDALGGINVDVPRVMNYDDNWGKLHIHLQPGKQRLTGEQTVGFLRWRKNKNGKGNSDDFSRTERQRQILVAIKDRLRTWDGIQRLPRVLKAFQENTQTNLSPTQFMVLLWASRQMQTDTVPGKAQTIAHISYVVCDWEYGRQRWQNAVK